MLETVVALLLFLKGDVVEHTYKERMSDCLKSKRLAERKSIQIMLDLAVRR